MMLFGVFWAVYGVISKHVAATLASAAEMKGVLALVNAAA